MSVGELLSTDYAPDCFYTICFRAPKKKLLKFLSNLKEEAKSNDSSIKVSAKDTGTKPAAAADEDGHTGLKSDISGNANLMFFCSKMF
jgi:hypothetical protein